MRILITGNSGSGKTTARLLLRSMLPQYTVVCVTYEGEVWWQEPFSEMVQTHISVNLLTNMLDGRADVILSIGNYYESLLYCRLPVDMILVTVCDNLERQHRVEQRLGRALNTEELELLSSLTTQPIEKCTLINNNGTKQALSTTLQQFVDTHQLRPLTMPTVVK